jgi:ATP-dependent DNA helicase RecG
MTKIDLLEMIHNGENSAVEFKRDTIDQRQLTKELVALANHFGGRVLLGVDDDGTIVGLTRDVKKLEEWVMQACRDKIRPEIIPYFEVIKDVEPGKSVAIVQVERGWHVHHLWHDQHRTYYIRVGTLSREASAEELQRLFQQRGAIRAEVRPVSGTSMNDLDMRRLTDYFSRIRQQTAPEEHDISSWQRLLVNTELMTQENDRLSVTMAGLLLFGKAINRYLPQAGIDAAAYPGDEKDYATLERVSLRGPLTGLFNSSNQLVEQGLVEQALEFVKRHTLLGAELDNGRRVEQWMYPMEAVREAVVNALIHRDYLLSATNIEISLYKNRLEVISPGHLPNGVTPERMKVGIRASRNQILKDVMRDYGYCEHMGMGVPRKIIKGMLEHNGTEPDLVEDGERFIVRLWRR